MRTQASLFTLMAELTGDVAELNRLASLNQRAWDRIDHGSDDPLDWGALGFTIHSIYGVLENYFLRVLKFFENNLPADRWHKVLIDKMALEVPPIRPALFDDQTLKHAALELMKFRHRFRNLYGEDLDPTKTAEIQRLTQDLLARFPGLHDRFVTKLQAIAAGLP